MNTVDSIRPLISNNCRLTLQDSQSVISRTGTEPEGLALMVKRFSFTGSGSANNGLNDSMTSSRQAMFQMSVVLKMTLYRKYLSSGCRIPQIPDPDVYRVSEILTISFRFSIYVPLPCKHAKCQVRWPAFSFPSLPFLPILLRQSSRISYEHYQGSSLPWLHPRTPCTSNPDNNEPGQYSAVC